MTVRLPLVAEKPHADKPVPEKHRPPHGRGITVIFKGSNECNGGCTFCSATYGPKGKVEWDDFERIASELDTLVRAWGSQQLRFTFHGGEPTLLGAAFLDRACKRIRALPTTVTFNMQSNLLEWNDDIERVVRDEQIKVGTSFDPIAGDRLDGAGRDAYPTWRANYEKLVKAGLSTGAIFVVTPAAIGRGRELYAVAQQIGRDTGARFGMQINHVYSQGRAADCGQLAVSATDFGQFLIDVWQAWEEGGRDVTLTPIKSFAEAFSSSRQTNPASCSFGGRCELSHVGIDHELHVAACGRRLDSKAYLGNLKNARLVDILETNEESRKVAARDDKLRQGECRDCRFFDKCHGGCPDDAWLGSGELWTKTSACEGYKMLFETLEKNIRREDPSRAKGPHDGGGGRGRPEPGEGHGAEEPNRPRGPADPNRPRRPEEANRPRGPEDSDRRRGPEPGRPRGPEGAGRRGGEDPNRPRGPREPSMPRNAEDPMRQRPPEEPGMPWEAERPAPMAPDRRPDRPEPRRAPGAEARGPLTVHAVTEPAEVARAARRSGNKEVWLLPTEDGRAYRYDSPLGQGLDPSTRVRLFVHNRHVRALTMWEDLLARPSVTVVLFESAGLAEALERLGLLRAEVELDVAAIEQDAGDFAPISAAAERFLFDPSWARPIHPFAELVLGGNRPDTSRRTRFGLATGSYRMTSPEAGDGIEAAAQRIVEGLRAGSAGKEADWAASRPSCAGCKWLALCAGRLAGGDGRPCPDAAKTLVERIVTASREAQAALGDRVAPA